MGLCRQNWLPAFLLTLLAIWMSGCDGSNGPGPDLNETAAAYEGGLAALGELEDAHGRLSSAATVYPGDQLAKSPGVTNTGGVLRIQSQPGGTAWAIWGWRNLDYSENHPLGVSLKLSYPSGKYYMGVPDFSRGCWRFSGALTGLQQQIDTTKISPLRASPDGVSYVAVVCHNGASVRLESLTLETGRFVRDGAPPVLWSSARYVEGSTASYIRVGWEDSRYNFNRYEVERWEAGGDPGSAVVFTEHQNLGIGHETGPIRGGQFRDGQVVPGRYYEYRVTGVEKNGKRSLPGPLALGYAGPQDEGSSLSGRVVYDEYFVAPGIGLYLPEAELYASTDLMGRYSFPGLDPGAYNVWVVSPVGPQHGALVLLAESETSVPDITVKIETVPEFNWHWLYPPLEVEAMRTGQRTVQLSWAEPQYATSYRVFRCQELEPDDLQQVYSGPQAGVTLQNEPSGELRYYVQAVETWKSWYMRLSPLSLGVDVTVPFTGITPDSIYAIPEKTSAHPGERVRVTVYTHKAANPLQYMNGCRISYEAANTIPPESFNVGEPGGATGDPDGVWVHVNPSSGILNVPIGLIRETDIGNGRRCCDYNVTPMGGSEATLATGALFNFEIEVHSDVHFSFIGSFDGLQRTYYSGGISEDFLWRDYYNYGQPGITLVEE